LIGVRLVFMSRRAILDRASALMVTAGFPVLLQTSGVDTEEPCGIGFHHPASGQFGAMVTLVGVAPSLV